MMLSGLAKDKPTHSPIDNNDERQDTMTGAETTHDTNCTIFQNKLPEEIPMLQTEESLSAEGYQLFEEVEEYLETVQLAEKVALLYFQIMRMISQEIIWSGVSKELLHGQ